jgi:hypothetical protein
MIQTGSEAHTASYTGASFLSHKRAELEADHSPPPSVEVKNDGTYTFTPTYVFIAWWLIN